MSLLCLQGTVPSNQHNILKSTKRFWKQLCSSSSFVVGTLVSYEHTNTHKMERQLAQPVKLKKNLYYLFFKLKYLISYKDASEKHGYKLHSFLLFVQKEINKFWLDSWIFKSLYTTELRHRFRTKITCFNHDQLKITNEVLDSFTVNTTNKQKWKFWNHVRHCKLNTDYD